MRSHDRRRHQGYYYDRQFLRPEDFNDEQAYHIAMRRDHNIAAHSWGIIEGLAIKVTDGTPYVLPGAAIDGYGRELILTDLTPVPVQRFAQTGQDLLDVWLYYERVASESAPAGYTGCGTTGSLFYPVGGAAGGPAAPTRRQRPARQARPAGGPRRRHRFPPSRLPPDDPARPWPVFLGQLRQDRSGPQPTYVPDIAGRPYAGLVGEQVAAPSGRARVQIGAEQDGDPRRFAVWVSADDPGGPRLQIDDSGEVGVRGNLTVNGDVTIDGDIELGVGPARAGPSPWSISRVQTDGGEELRIELPCRGHSRAGRRRALGRRRQRVPALPDGRGRLHRHADRRPGRGRLGDGARRSLHPRAGTGGDPGRRVQLPTGVGNAGTLLDQLFPVPFAEALTSEAGLRRVARELAGNPAGGRRLRPWSRRSTRTSPGSSPRTWALVRGTAEVDGRMGRLHCRYNLSGGDTAGVRARLDRVAAQAVTRTGSALHELLGDTPAVYVLREVTTRHRWSVSQLSDDELGELWGHGIATAVVRAIASDPGGGSNLIRFGDHADYVASFVADLVNGSAWSHWWYGAFTPYAARPRRQALLDVLLEHRAGLADILAVLYRRGALGRVVDALGEPARRVLWGAPVIPPPPGREAVRPLLAAAIELARALGLWGGRLDQAAALERFAATSPRERAWSDPRDLADGVWEAFRWLDAAGALEATAPGQAGPAVAGAAGRGVSGPAGSGPAGLVDAALAPLDWLDQALLRDRLVDHLIRGPGASPAAGREMVRPLLAAAIELARALGLWGGRLDQAAALERFAATSPRERAWSDPRDLADGVWEAFRWLDAAGALEATAPGQAGPAVAGAAGRGVSGPAGGPAGLVDAALAPLDWLDQALLRGRLVDHLSGRSAGGDLPVRPPLVPTPRQEELVLALLRLARSGAAGLDLADPSSAANALRLYAALADSTPQFRNDPSVPPLVERLLGAWSWVAAQAWPAAALDRLRRGDIPPAPAGHGAPSRADRRIRCGDAAVRRRARRPSSRPAGGPGGGDRQRPGPGQPGEQRMCRRRAPAQDGHRPAAVRPRRPGRFPTRTGHVTRSAAARAGQALGRAGWSPTWPG